MHIYPPSPPPPNAVYFQVIKDFEESGFVQDDTGAVRKTSVFRVNPLAAMMASMEDSEGSELEDVRTCGPRGGE